MAKEVYKDAECARAEIAVEKILRRLEVDTGLKIKMVSVDTKNSPTLSVEIFLPD